MRTLLLILMDVLVFLAPVAMIVGLSPRRAHFASRVTIAVAIFATFQYLMQRLGMPFFSGSYGAAGSFCFNLVQYSLMVALLATLARLVHQTTWPTALFAAAASYTLQNLGSGMASLVAYATTGSWDGIRSPLLHWGNILACVAIVYVVGYLTLVRSIRRRGATEAKGSSALVLVLLAIFYNIAFDLAAKSLGGYDVPPAYVVIIMLAHVGTCILILFLAYELLYNRRLIAETSTMDRLMQDREQQYEMSRENIDAINMKAHDIRHQIRSLGERSAVSQDVLDDIAREVAIYDSAVKTGNEALDTILSEKSLLCERKGIALSCIADGRAVAFLSPAELYSLFGNALDNAMEAVEKVADKDHRSISLSVRAQIGMAVVHVENYCAEKVAFVDGLPLTSKGDTLNHGYGTRSMQAIAERHGGTLTAEQQGDVYYLNVIMPIPKA